MAGKRVCVAILMQLTQPLSRPLSPEATATAEFRRGQLDESESDSTTAKKETLHCGQLLPHHANERDDGP